MNLKELKSSRWPFQVLVMAASGDGCERNWYTYEIITNGKRNKLSPGRAEDLIYVHHNTRCALKSREPEQSASWFDEDLRVLPAATM
jgi:hypothetical protein